MNNESLNRNSIIPAQPPIKPGQAAGSDESVRRMVKDLEEAQQASLNIIEDLQKSKEELEMARNAYLNIMEDMDKKGEALKESKEFAELIYKVTPSAIFTVDNEKRITSWNIKATQITGFSQEEMIGKSCAAFAEEPCRSKCGLFDSLTQKPINAKECSIIHKSGRRIFISKNVDILKDINDNIIGGIESFEDITGRKLAEEVLRERVKELNCLYVIADLIEKDDSLEKILQGSADVMPNAWAHPEIACIRIIFKGRQYQTGNFRKTDWRQSADLKVDGQPVGMIELCYLEERPIRDEGPFLREERNLINAIAERLGRVVERKQAEEALRESEKLLSTFIKHSPIYTYIKEVTPNESRVIMASENFVDLTGVLGSEMVGKTMDELFPAEFAAKITADDWAVVSSGKILKLEENLNGRNYTSIKSPIFHEGKNLLAGYTIDITERKQAEDALRETEARYKALFTGAAEGILVADLQMKQFRYANPAICRMFGYTEEELIGMGVADIHPKESLEHVLAEFEAQARGEKTLAPDLPCLRKDGTLFYANISGISVVIEGHKCNVGFFTDITERKRIQDMLALSESEMRTTLYSIGDAVISLNLNGCVLMMNPVAEKLTGWSESEAHGKLLEDVLCIVNEETRCKVDNPVVRVLNEGSVVGMANHTLLIARDGTEHPIGDSASPIFDQNFNVTGVVLIFRDLTKEREAEGKILDQLAIIETYNGFVALADMNGKLIYINPGGIKMLGATKPDEILDKNITDFIEQTNLKHVTDEWIPTAIRDGVWDGEHTLKRIDGTSIPVAQTIFSIRDVEGNLRHMGTIIVDISIQKEMQGKLLTSEKLAVMGRLVADVAHEINNPLAIIIGRTQLMLRRIDEQPSPYKGQLETVLQSARRCKTILSNLLSYSRTIGKKEDAVNLPDLIREAVDNVNYQYDMSAIEVALNFNLPTNTEITGNKVALLSVFVNLIRNARQAMREKGNLTITVEKENEIQLRIEIHDTGIGISKEQMTKLFQPFISGWKEDEGTGLGLATSLGIIETHGGKMSAESEGEGKGAKFTILLPYKLKEEKTNQTINKLEE